MMKTPKFHPQILAPFILSILMAGCRQWGGCSDFSAEDVRWLTDETSPNYRHLEPPGQLEPFPFKAANLVSLSQLNHFDIYGGQDEVLFGLRGCAIVGSPDGDFSTSVTLIEDTPDHIGYHGVIGVWKRSSGPAVQSLQEALQDRGHTAVPASGFMGPDTTFAFIQWQNEGAADGIVSPEIAEDLGFSLDP